MAINRAENKVRVTKLLGSDAYVGLVDPKIGMTTNHGPILSLDSGNFQIVVGVGTGDTPRKFYPHDLNVTFVRATGVGDAWSSAYPTGVGCTSFTRSNAWPNGVPDALGSGIAYLAGNGVPTVYPYPR